MLEVEPPDR